MRSSKILDVLQSAVKPVTNYFTPIATSTITLLSTASSFHSTEPSSKSERVEMKATKSSVSAASTAKMIDRIKQCASKDKKQPEIFIALLQKQDLPADEINDFAKELARNGKARELDALAGKYKLPKEFVVDTIREANKSETYQELLQAKEDLKNIGYLFDPNNSVTIVEASDKKTIYDATLAADSKTTKRIITVDTTEEYAPHHKENIVQRREIAPTKSQLHRLFQTDAPLAGINISPLSNKTNLLPGFSDEQTVRHHI